MSALTTRFSVLMVFFVIVSLGACARAGAMQQDPPEPQTVYNIDASGDEYVYYSLRDNGPVEAAGARGDAWDVAFQGTNILVNGSMQLLETPFDDVLSAPEDGYERDDSGQTTLPGGSGNGWYLYDATVHQVMPIPGRTLVLKTATGAYAKVEIVSYYFMDPSTGSDEGGDPRFYTFRFAYQADGSRVLGQ